MIKMTIVQAAKEITKTFKKNTLMWKEVNQETSPLLFKYEGIIQLFILYHTLGIDCEIDSDGNIYESSTHKMIFKRIMGEEKV